MKYPGKNISRKSIFSLAMSMALVMAAQAGAQIVHSDDVVVEGHMCIGLNCGEPIGNDTILFKDNNLRLRFDDTSTQTGFPANDWQLAFNDTVVDGDNYFAIEDNTASTVPFVIEAGAASSSIYVDDAGNVGMGTASPAVPLHVARSTSGILEGIKLSNNNEARISIENTGLSARYIMAVSNTSPGHFFISRDGGGGPIFEVSQRFDGGVGAPSVNVYGSVQATNVTFSSSRELKEAFAELDPQEILDKVTALPVTKWRFKTGSQVEHIGPMAEDFHDAFGLNSDNKTISMTDTSGVALLAIQGLNQRLVELEKQNVELKKALEALQAAQKN